MATAYWCGAASGDLNDEANYWTTAAGTDIVGTVPDSGDTVLKADTVTFTPSSGTSNATWNVAFGAALITGGTFNGPFTCGGNVNGGTFNGAFTLTAYNINSTNSPNFYGPVTLSGNSNAYGGEFYGPVTMSSTGTISLSSHATNRPKVYGNITYAGGTITLHNGPSSLDSAEYLPSLTLGGVAGTAETRQIPLRNRNI